MFSPDYVWIVHPRVESVDKWLSVKDSHVNLTAGCTDAEYKLFSERILLFDQQNFRHDGKKSISGLVSDDNNTMFIRW